MQDGGKFPQEHLGGERYAVKETGLVGVAHIDALVLEGSHLLVQVKGTLQVIERVDIGPLDEPVVGIVGYRQHLVEIQCQARSTRR